MKSYTETILSYLKADFAQNPKREGEALMDALYYHYVENGGADGEELGKYSKKISQELQDLSYTRRDTVQCTVNELCGVFERIAFLDGVRTGAKLVLELME